MVTFRVRNANGSTSPNYYVTVGGTLTVEAPFNLSTDMAHASGMVRTVVEVVRVD